MTKIVSYNVNGIRAALGKGLIEWLKAVNADIVCFQEIKANPEQFDASVFEEIGYKHYWYPAVKKGYSGTAILTRIQPKLVTCGMGIEKYDFEGRMIRADFDDFSVISVYHPSGSSGDERQGFKMIWLEDFQNYINELKKEIPNLIISGDYNICHRAIDIHDPKGNANSSGFLPEEREWIDSFIKTGFVDTFRYFNDQPNNYSWWSYRANARANNKGWRIDYHMAAKSLENRLKRALILPDAMHSDHCPIIVEID
ncbi:MAG: exodeoxyribonuclease III [Bacteroidota bacterium]